MMALWLAACTGPAPSQPSPVHPLDDVLSLSHAQAVGTHNSYHVQTVDLDAWAYTHAPLDVQVAELGIRQFELDVYWREGEWVVLHLPDIDAETTCATLALCLQDLEAGVQRVGGKTLPLVVLIEPKEAHDVEEAEAQLMALDADLSALGNGRILPAEVEGAWPMLEGQRGRYVFVWHTRGPWRDTALAVQPESLFLDGYGDLDAEGAAVHSINDPTDPRIAQVVTAGHLVRTRADADGVEAAANDSSRLEMAKESGAHFFSTDFPVPHASGYVVDLEGPSAVRCNPSTAPNECGALLLEDPALLR